MNLTWLVLNYSCLGREVDRTAMLVGDASQHKKRTEPRILGCRAVVVAKNGRREAAGLCFFFCVFILVCMRALLVI